MPDGQKRRRSQREIREGRAPRRLAERSVQVHMHEVGVRGGAAHLTRQLAVAIAVLVLVIASTIVHSDEYSPPSGPYVGAGWGQFDLHLYNLNDVGTAVTDITHSNDDAWKGFRRVQIRPVHRRRGGLRRLRSSERYLSDQRTIPLGPVEIFGNAGYYFYNLDTRVDFSSGPFLESRHSRSDFLFGAGLGVTLFHHLNLRSEYERIDIDNARFGRLLAQSVMALLGVDGSWPRLARPMQMSPRADSGEQPIAQVIQRSG